MSSSTPPPPFIRLVSRPEDDYPFDDGYALEDDYPAIHDDDIAYAVFDWDDLDPDLVERHDALLELSLAELDALELTSLNDLLLFAVARARLGHGDTAAYVDLCARILAIPAPDRTRWLSWPDLRIERARKLADLERFDEALDELQRYADEPDASPSEHKRYQGLTLLRAGRRDEGLAMLTAAIDHHELDDPELALYLGDELLALNDPQAAVVIYQAGLAVARRRRLPDLHAELEDALSGASKDDDSAKAP